MGGDGVGAVWKNYVKGPTTNMSNTTGGVWGSEKGVYRRRWYICVPKWWRQSQYIKWRRRAVSPTTIISGVRSRWHMIKVKMRRREAETCLSSQEYSTSP